MLQGGGPEELLSGAFELPLLRYQHSSFEIGHRVFEGFTVDELSFCRACKRWWEGVQQLHTGLVAGKIPGHRGFLVQFDELLPELIECRDVTIRPEAEPI